MSESRSAGPVRSWVGTVLFLVVAPGVVAGLVPWLISGWREPAAWGPQALIWVVSAVLIVPGVWLLLDAFVRFARASGTPAPIAPTARLVVVGPYRFVRNPMYIAVVAIIVGQALLFGNWWVLVWGVAVAVAVALFVYGYEQPTLARDYGDEYARYCANVRAWVPRLRPWNPS
jgi:protein-S-isoprenylcysteine O-methyltransferase Ste14